MKGEEHFAQQNPHNNDLSFQFSLTDSCSIDQADRSKIMAILAANMEHMWVSDVNESDNVELDSRFRKTQSSWCYEDKREELFYSTARFILVHSANKLIGFANWRFDAEECEDADPSAREDAQEVEVLYWCVLQD